MLQTSQISLDQCFFLPVAPAFELPFSCYSLVLRVKCLRIDQVNRAMLERVRRASTIVVSLHASVNLWR
jgi:hypothetical protein